MKSVAKRSRYPRYRRKQQILSALYFWGQNGISMTAIAYWINVRPSNHLMKILHEMEKGKLIVHATFPWREGVPVFLWQLTEIGEFARELILAGYEDTPS